MSAGKRSIATTEHIAIIGAGIGGLAAARALALHGYQITVFEQAEELTEVGAGLQIGPNGIAVMEALGLREVAEPFASIPEAVELHNQAAAR